MVDSFDFLRHFVICLHPLGFFFMTIKEIADVSNGYLELYDWLANFTGITYYLLFSTIVKQAKTRRVFN